MKATTILRTLMKAQSLGNAALGKRIGQAHNIVYQRVHQKNISVDTMNQMLAAMDYKIVIVPASRRTREDEFEVTMEDEA